MVSHRDGRDRLGASFAGSEQHRVLRSWVELIGNTLRIVWVNWDRVFEIPIKRCQTYLEYGAKEYLLDGGKREQGHH